MLTLTTKQEEAIDLLRSPARHVMLYGGSRCLSGDSVLDGHSKTIRDQAEDGLPVIVQTTHGQQLVEAPFCKGRDSLMRFDLQCGRSVKVTSDHRFWDGHRWVHARNLKQNDSIAVALCASSQPFPHMSISAPYLLEFDADAPHSTGKLVNYRDDCFSHLRRYGLPLHLLQAFVSVCRALQFYEWEHTRAGHSPVVRGLNTRALHLYRRALECSRYGQQLCHLSMMDDSPWTYRLALFLILAYARTCESSPGIFGTYQKYQWQYFHHQSVALTLGNFSYQFDQFLSNGKVSCDTPLTSGYRLSQIANITTTSVENYYTLHVPGSQQYFANGVLHHNSGKTALLCYTILLRAILASETRHLILRKHFNHVKRSIWHDTLPKIKKLAFPDLAWDLNKSDWFITLPNKSQIWIGGLDDKERVEKILGNEYSTIYFNENSEMSHDAVQTALTRLAQKSKLHNKALYDQNPPSKRHWTYSIFIKHEDPESKRPLNKDKYAVMLMNPRDNAQNLADGYIEDVLQGLSDRQRRRFELGEWMDDVEGALWSIDLLDKFRTYTMPEEIKRTVIAVDPAVSSLKTSDNTGIIVACLGKDNQGYVVHDATFKGTPNQWGQRAVDLYDEYDADIIVGEVNNGGDLVESVIRNIDKTVNYKAVRASKGKYTRAEPVAALYEKGMVHHVGTFPDLEDQMTTFVPDSDQDSPDNMDAAVYGLTELMIKNKKSINSTWGKK